jgi:hypothetical protein
MGKRLIVKVWDSYRLSDDLVDLSKGKGISLGYLPLAIWRSIVPGKASLKVKVGKRFRLIPGRLTVEYESNREYWIFTPNAPKTFRLKDRLPSTIRMIEAQQKLFGKDCW